MKENIKNFIKAHPKLYEIFKFGVAGAITTLIDLAVMAIIIFLFTPSLRAKFIDLVLSNHNAPTHIVVLATSLGFLVSLIASYLLSYNFVFKSRLTSFTYSKRGLILYLLISLLGFTIHSLGMYLGYDILSINEWIVKIFLTLLVMVISYTLRKLLIFKKSSNS